MGAYIFVGSFGGDYLDSSLNNNKPIFTIIGALLGVFLGLYQLFKSIKKKQTLIKFNVEFEFKRFFHQKIAEAFYPLIENKMIESFKVRADEILD